VLFAGYRPTNSTNYYEVLGFTTFYDCLCSGCTEKLDCARFKIGKFYVNLPGSGEKILIERNDTIQVETNTGTGEGSKHRIEWLNDCEYRLVTMTNNRVLKDGTDSFFATIPINVAIISTGKDYYVFKTRIDSASKHVEYTDTIRVEN
jgi:hypothetical protein